MKVELKEIEKKEVQGGDFAIWETDSGEQHVAFVLSNDHGRVHFISNGARRGDYSANLTTIGTLVTDLPEEEKPEEKLYWDVQKIDKPGLWALQPPRKCDIELVYVVRDPKKWDGEYPCCYLGPAPEILNRPKPVTIRMWGEPWTGGTLRVHWFKDGDETPKSRGFIRTDKTKQT